jgi:hypothetical protein
MPSASSSKLRSTALDAPNTADMPKPAEKPAELQNYSRHAPPIRSRNHNDFKLLEWRARKDSNL